MLLLLSQMERTQFIRLGVINTARFAPNLDSSRSDDNTTMQLYLVKIYMQKMLYLFL